MSFLMRKDFNLPSLCTLLNELEFMGEKSTSNFFFAEFKKIFE
jgi:hypothetical protein